MTRLRDVHAGARAQWIKAGVWGAVPALVFRPTVGDALSHRGVPSGLAIPLACSPLSARSSAPPC